MNDELICLRRKLHQIPETGWLEIETTIFLIEYLKQFNIELKFGKQICGKRLVNPDSDILKKLHEKHKHLYKKEYEEIFRGYTGVIAKIDTGKEGKNFLFRFDIDGLPITETKLPGHIPNKENFSSKNIGAMHACGHDGHAALGLCFVKWISENIDILKGTFTIVFQPAEEGVGGASALIQKMDLSIFDYCLGLHIGLGMEEDVIGVDTKEFYGVKYTDVEFFGKAAHSANSPENGKNALLAAANAALLIHSLPQYSLGIARVNVGKLNAGTAGNIVPEYAKMTVEIRSTKQEILDSLEERFRRICKNSADSFGASCSFKITGACNCFETNDDEFANRINEILQNAKLKTRLNPLFKASEDITDFMSGVSKHGGKAIHLLIGTNLKAPHHNQCFDFDEKCLFGAFTALTEIVKAL